MLDLVIGVYFRWVRTDLNAEFDYWGLFWMGQDMFKSQIWLLVFILDGSGQV